MHIEALKISFWLVQKPRKHRSWLAGRGWQVVVAELIPVTWPKTSHLIGSNQIFNHDHDRIAASYTKPLPEPMLRKVCVSIWCHQVIMGSRQKSPKPWWRHQMEIFSALLAICAHKGQWRGALILSLICAWINHWVNNGEAGDLRRYRANYDVTVMSTCSARSMGLHAVTRVRCATTPI